MDRDDSRPPRRSAARGLSQRRAHPLPESSYTDQDSNDGHMRPLTAESGRTSEGPASFVPYPGNQPFIYDDFRRETSEPSKAYPENNRQAVMSALQTLQNKIRALEHDRLQAEDNLKTLATETSQYREILNAERDRSYSRPVPDPEDLSRADRDPDLWEADAGDGSRLYNYSTAANTTAGATDVHYKLDTAEQRCTLLERQLEYMRNLVHNAEQERSQAERVSALRAQQHQELETSGLRAQLDKISSLERDHLRLTATQTVAENKLRELEEKLKEERRHRKLVQQRAAELETAAETKRILQDATEGSQSSRKPKTTKRKKKKVTSSKHTNGAAPCRPTASSSRKSTSAPSRGSKVPGMAPTEHYKLKMGEMPFLSGKSVTPSHHLAANFQEVLSLMKAHNPKLCRSPRSHLRNGYNYFRDHEVATLSSRIPKNGTDRDLTELLLQLQDEFSRMSLEHQELRQQIQESTDVRLRDDLERELDELVTRMEAKGDQITRLRRHQEQLKAKNSRPKTRCDHDERPSRDTDPAHHVNGEVEVTTTVRTKGKAAGNVVVRPEAPNRATASLSLYKGLKKIQTTLRKDDISWDC